MNLNDVGNYDFSSNTYLRSYFNDFDISDVSCKYFSEIGFANELKDSKDFLIISMNVRSLSKRFDELKSFLQVLSENNIKPDIIACQEIWQPGNLNDFSIPGYKIIGKTRTSMQGGGVAFLIAEHLHYELFDTFFEENIFESQGIIVHLNNGNRLSIVNLYRPNTHHSLSFSNQCDLFLSIFADQLEILNNLNIPTYICSDSNANLLRCGLDNFPTNFIEQLSCYGFSQILSKATRICGTSYSLIDHISTNDHMNVIKKCGILTDTTSDHFYTFVSLNFVSEKKDKFTYQRNFSVFNKRTFKNYLNEETWNEVYLSDSADKAMEVFSEKFNLYFDLCFPIQKVKPNKNRHSLNPFMSSGLLKSRSTKLKLAKMAKLKPTETNLSNFKKYRNIYNTLIKKAKKIHFRNKIAGAKGDSKKTWDVINEAINCNKNNDNIDHILKDDVKIIDKMKIANLFNEHFSKIGNKVAEKVPKTAVNFKDFLPPPQEETFYLRAVTTTELVSKVIHMNKKKSLDINDLSLALIQEVILPISKPLTFIFNLSISLSQFPNTLKVSKVIPIFKKSGDKNQLGNYRGISLINTFSKIFEKLVSDQLSLFFYRTNFFHENQFGFLKGKSTNQALLKIINFISEAINNNKISLAVFLDLQKAFDSLNHDILWDKLENAGVRGEALNWFKSYMSNRRQRVKIENLLSENECQITIGVLQGSILGVVLFLVYINDIFYASDLLLNVAFADDLSSLLSDYDLNNLLNTANSEIGKLVTWYNANKLSLHPTKSKVMLFKAKFKTLELPIVNDYHYIPLFINLNSENENDITKIVPIRLVPNQDESYIKVLGVLIDEHLNLKFHMNLLSTKLARTIGIMRKLAGVLDVNTLKLVYFAHIQSNLTYCCNLFCLASKSDIDKILILQKKAIRLIFNVHYLAHTEQLFIQADILPIQSLIKSSILKFMFDYKNLLLPPSFDFTWTENWRLRYHVLRNESDYHLPHVKYVYLFDHPLFAFPKIWNNLDNSLKVEQNKLKFCTSIRQIC